MGRFAVILLAVLCMSGRPIFMGSPQCKDLQIFYPLNQSGGKTTWDSYIVRNARDTLRGDALFAYGSLVLDGTGDFVSLVHNPAHIITDRFTISLWMWPADAMVVDGCTPDGTGMVPADNNYAILFEYVADQVEFYAGGYTGTNPRTGSGMTIPNAVNWHHVVYSYNGATLNGYVDGVLKISVATVFSLQSASNSFLSIGGNYQFGNQFQGRLKDVRLYNRGLVHSEIMQLYVNPNGIYK